MPPMQRHAVHRRGHAVLADAVMDEAAGVVGRRHRLHRLGAGVVGAGEVGRAADHFRHRRDEALQRELATPCGSRSPSARRRASPSPRGPRRRAPPGRSPRMRRSNSARLSAGSAARRLSHAARAAFERWPAARHCVSTSAGISNGASLQPSFSRAPLISSAPSGEPCDARLAGLGRRAVADGGLAGDHGRAVGRLAPSRSPPRWPRDRGRRCAMAFQPAASKRFT